jgi:hypothetical protein
MIAKKETNRKERRKKLKNRRRMKRTRNEKEIRQNKRQKRKRKKRNIRERRNRKKEVHKGTPNGVFCREQKEGMKIYTIFLSSFLCIPLLHMYTLIYTCPINN